MEEKSYTSTHPLGHTGPVTGTLYLHLFHYKYPNNLISVILPAYTTYEDETESVYRNVGI